MRSGFLLVLCLTLRHVGCTQDELDCSDRPLGEQCSWTLPVGSANATPAEVGVWAEAWCQTTTAAYQTSDDSVNALWPCSVQTLCIWQAPQPQGVSQHKAVVRLILGCTRTYVGASLLGSMITSLLRVIKQTLQTLLLVMEMHGNG